MQSKKKRQRTKFCEINDILEDIVKHSIPSKLKKKRCITSPPLNEDAIGQVSSTNTNATPPTANPILRSLILKGLSTENQGMLEEHQEKSYDLQFISEDHRNRDTSENQIQQYDRPETISGEVMTSKAHLQHHNTSENTMNLEQCNFMMDLFGNYPMPTVSTFEMDTEPSVHLSDTMTSPLTATTNMLEALMKRPDEASVLSNFIEKPSTAQYEDF
jgi:hypothetical protein